MAKETTNKPVVGVDLGGTKVLAGVVDADGKVLATAKRATKSEVGVEAVVERIAKTVREAVKVAGLELDDIAGLASGAPGILNPSTGVVRYAPNMVGWEEVPFAQLLSKAVGVPAFIENDANLGTLGEQAWGAGVGYRTIAGIFVGTGIGGGLILDGRLWQGSHKAAGEIGHMIVMADGPVCGCGSRGCVEAFASRTALERDIWAGIKAGRETTVAELMREEGRERITSGVLAAAFQQHDPLVSEVLGRAQFYLGILIASLINFIDPEVVILGGGVIEALGEEFLVPIRRVARQYPINKQDARDIPIVPAALGDHAALLGAAVYARQRLAE